MRKWLCRLLDPEYARWEKAIHDLYAITPDLRGENEPAYKARLIRDYEILIHEIEEAYNRRGAGFFLIISGEQGRLTLAALKTALDRARQIVVKT